MPGKHLVDDRRKMVFFLDPESAAGDVDVIGRDLVDGIVFAAFLEGSSDTEKLAQRSELLDRRDPTGGCYAGANKVDQPVFHQRNEFSGWEKTSPTACGVVQISRMLR